MSETSPEPSPLTSRRRWATLPVLVLAVLMLAIDSTVLAVAIPALAEGLGASGTEVLWIGDIYSLAVAGFLVVMGNLGDRIGRKRLLLTGATLFGLASAVGAFSQSPGMLIVARLAMGISGATLMPSTLSLIRNIFSDRRERTLAISIWSAAAGGGSALGPLLGGFFLEHFWWGSVFLINVPVMVMLVLGGVMLLPESRDPNPGRFDLLSAALSLAAVMPIVYAIKHAAQFGVDPTALVTLLVGVMMALVFVRRQKHLQTPLIDIDLFRNRAFTGSVLANFIAMFAMVGLLYFYSQYLQLARGFTPLQAGLAELPTTIASVVVVFVVTRVLARLGEGHTIGSGLVLTALGLAGVAAAEGASSFVWLALALIPVGLGVGLSQTVATDAIVSAVPAHKAGAASAISETSYELGSALGIAVLGSLVNAVYRANLDPGAVEAGQWEAVSDSLAGALHVLDAGSPAARMAREAFTGGMQITAAVASLITILAAVIAWRLVPSRR